MTKFEKIAKAWILYQLHFGENNFWAVEELIELSTTKPFETWEVIKAIMVEEISDEDWELIYPILGAGAIEEVLSYFGDEIIAVIEKEAISNDKLRSILKIPYKHRMSDSVWNRLLKIREG